jgi:virginiamycin A acetyltransferase
MSCNLEDSPPLDSPQARRLSLASRMGDSHMTVRAILRKWLVWVCVVITSPLWILARLEERFATEFWFSTGSELLSLVPGPFGIFLRRGFYRMTLESFSDDCGICFGSVFTHREVYVEMGVFIGGRSMIGMARIEEHATIGSNVDILSGSRQHTFESLDRPIQDQRGTFKPVRIGRNAWIGNSAVIMADVASNCVIGAGSVVVHAIPECSVAVGNPARVIRTRQDSCETSL